MTDLYTWTDNATEVGVANCDPDVLDSNLMHLKYDNVSKFDDKGAISADFTLASNVVTLGAITGLVELTLPIVTDTSNQVICVFDFSTDNTGLTLPSELKWSDKNQGKSPSAYSIISGVRNVLTFKTIVVSSAIVWEVEYTSYGGVETAFNQPVLSADGTLGGSDFAISVSSFLGAGYEGYKAFDNNTSTYWHSATSDLPTSIIVYNPNGLKLSNLAFTNAPSGGATNYITGYTIYRSNDNITYTTYGGDTNSNITAGATWDKAISETEFYKYLKITITSANGGATATSLAQLTLTGVYIAI